MSSSGHGADDSNVQTPPLIPATAPADDVEVEVSIRIGDRIYRMYLEADGIAIPGTTQSDPTGLSERIAEAMHRALWDADGQPLPEVFE